jgi:enoyl-CoA hydratase/carnithine racemase
MTDQVATVLADGVLTLRMNRPEKKNALTGEMYLNLAAAIDNAAADAAVRVILICGTDGCFSAGNDLGDFLRDGGADRQLPAPSHHFIRALVRTTVPMIAAVDGVAVGIGTTMLLHCDFVYATARARFSLPFINLAVVPEAGSSLLLPRLVGHLRAAELLMLGEAFDGIQAKDYGMVSDICTPEELMGRATATALKLAAKSRSALRETKALLKRDAEALGERVDAEIASFSEQLKSGAARELMGAFMEKRPPDPSKCKD